MQNENGEVRESSVQTDKGELLLVVCVRDLPCLNVHFAREKKLQSCLSFKLEEPKPTSG